MFMCSDAAAVDGGGVADVDDHRKTTLARHRINAAHAHIKHIFE